MDTLGKEYIINHVVHDVKKKNVQEMYAFFMSEMVRSMTNTLSKNFGGVEFKKNFEELKNYKPDTRTGDEVKSQVLNRMQKLKEGYEQWT